MTFKAWLRDQLTFVESVAADDDPQPADFDALRDLVREAQKRAASNGLPDAVAACAMRPGPITPSIAREALAACLATLQHSVPSKPPVKDAPLTVQQAAAILNRPPPGTVYQLVKEGRIECQRSGRT